MAAIAGGEHERDGEGLRLRHRGALTLRSRRDGGERERLHEGWERQGGALTCSRSEALQLLPGQNPCRDSPAVYAVRGSPCRGSATLELPQGFLRRESAAGESLKRLSRGRVAAGTPWAWSGCGWERRRDGVVELKGGREGGRGAAWRRHASTGLAAGNSQGGNPHTDVPACEPLRAFVRRASAQGNGARRAQGTSRRARCVRAGARAKAARGGGVRAARGERGGGDGALAEPGRPRELGGAIRGGGGHARLAGGAGQVEGGTQAGGGWRSVGGVGAVLRGGAAAVVQDAQGRAGGARRATLCRAIGGGHGGWGAAGGGVVAVRAGVALGVYGARGARRVRARVRRLRAPVLLLLLRRGRLLARFRVARLLARGPAVRVEARVLGLGDIAWARRGRPARERVELAVHALGWLEQFLLRHVLLGRVGVRGGRHVVVVVAIVIVVLGRTRGRGARDDGGGQRAERTTGCRDEDLHQVVAGELAAPMSMGLMQREFGRGENRLVEVFGVVEPVNGLYNLGGNLELSTLSLGLWRNGERRKGGQAGGEGAWQQRTRGGRHVVAVVMVVMIVLWRVIAIGPIGRTPMRRMPLRSGGCWKNVKRVAGVRGVEGVEGGIYDVFGSRSSRVGGCAGAGSEQTPGSASCGQSPKIFHEQIIAE
ncbi:hypothetical protein B0H17DRAFT_1124605 [Mycena rosella]|uniref:Uncharacterized protein n=1 Tax=Mycena rosella TaxID=1033263 RepID=A0AAD7GZF9_MYCRO|nr:hypothetical protein B0H17DRAFT_1124605 [Mycena rosella]